MIEEGDYRACIVHMPEIDWPCVRFLNSDGIQANIPINVLDRMMPALKDLLDRAFKPATCPFCDSTHSFSLSTAVMFIFCWLDREQSDQCLIELF